MKLSPRTMIPAVLCVVVSCMLLAVPSFAQGSARMKLVFCCKEDNDLYDMFASRGGKWQRFENPTEAVRFAQPDSGVLLLADGYPDEMVKVAPELFDLAAAKNVRIYIEFPNEVPGLDITGVEAIGPQRGVISSDWFAPALKKTSILSLHQCSFAKIGIQNSHILLMRAAGYNEAVFGLGQWQSPLLSKEPVYPLLLKNPLGEILVAGTKLSGLKDARFAPIDAWRVVWEKILGWLAGEKVLLPDFDPISMTAYRAEDILPPDAAAQALRNGVQWLANAKLIVNSSWKDKAAEAAKKPDAIGNRLNVSMEPGDGSCGILEGLASFIDSYLEQSVCYSLRGDSMSESAMALAFDGVVNNSPRSLEIAENLLNFIYAKSPLAQGSRADAQNMSFGFLGDSIGGKEGVYSADGNARAILSAITGEALLKKNQLDENILRNLLANLRVTGPDGFRPAVISEDSLQKAGWRHYFNTPSFEPSPSNQAYMWAAFLWAYKQTGYAPFLDRAKAGITRTMEAYPDKWKWTEGMQQERAKMLLPLSWLVRVEDSPEHRELLKRVAMDLLAAQDASGAIQEQLGAPEFGANQPPKSNEEYGTGDIPVIQQNGDPASDLRFTCNYALLGLREAAEATHEPAYVEGEKKLADFLCRVQIHAEESVEIDGAWFRSFDFKRWEYWGCDGNPANGAWSVGAGDTQGWICSVLALRTMNSSLWDLVSKSNIKDHATGLVAAMLPEAFEVPADEKISHLAVGKSVALTTPYFAPFSGGGPQALTDGRIAKPDHAHPAWQGFAAADLDAVIDLGEPTAVKQIQTSFLQSAVPGALLPTSVEYSVGLEVNAMNVVATIPNDVPAANPGPAAKAFTADIPETQARFIRIHAINAGVIPDGLPEKGKNSMLLADEIAVR